MGVSQLWPILHPCARPTKLETLNRKRLAVDASIWIYQFLKAVRDKEGNALRNSHVVGFFRRICKLLFFGIKPVFVFDGGAPALKRQTVLSRKRRREGRRDDAARTAGKLLAVQMQRRVEEEEERRKREIQVRGRPAIREEEEEQLPDEDKLVYVDEMALSMQERKQARKFTKKDAYHLPDLNGSIENMGQPNDPRIMSTEELEEYARQFNSGEDINLYDFSKIDFNGEFFMSLPAGDRYNILNAARLRSRLRMGLSKEQLEEMFPDRMAFSRFQIERVRERNELTQRLMNLNGMNGEDAMFGVGGRIAGERGREYVLVKNDGVEGGWALGVVSTDKEQGARNKPIDVDAIHQRRQRVEDNEEWEDEDDFEDVPIEGLNRLPKIQNRGRLTYEEFKANEAAEQRRQFYASRKNNGSLNQSMRTPDEFDSMFVDGEDGTADLEENSRLANTVVDEDAYSDEDEELKRAIAISLEADENEPANTSENPRSSHTVIGERTQDEEEDDINRAIAMSLQQHHNRQISESEDDEADFEDVIMPAYQQRAVEEPRPLAKSSGRMVAHMVNNRANAAVPKRKAASVSSDDGDMDLQSALAASRKEQSASKRKFQPAPKPVNIKNPFDGPLPFEKLDFKTSLFGTKKSKVVESEKNDFGDGDVDMAGGFQRDGEQDAPRPMPPWIAKSGDIRSDVREQKVRDLEIDAEDRKRAAEERRIYERDHGVIDIESSDEGGSDVEILDAPPPKKLVTTIDLTSQSIQSSQRNIQAKLETEKESEVETRSPLLPMSDESHNSPSKSQPVYHTERKVEEEMAQASEEEFVEWSDSDREDHPNIPIPRPDSDASATRVESSEIQPEPETSKSPSPLFEDVAMPYAAETNTTVALELESALPAATHDDAFDEADIVSDVDFDQFSDPEDEELLAQLAIEAEEHARFASTLNNRSEKENRDAYERELKQLRNQQKKDRRDADEVSHIMITECQNLLRLFGLPYITAPMEAEAQCAELVNLGLVDGIVTDDSDIFLFGGTRVYKNMFNSNKFVECYLSSDLEKELSLSRDQLIAIAHLLGSDYTEGLPGIGPVTALEILSEFPAADGLQEFKSWWTEVQQNTIPKEADAKSPFRKKFRRTQGTKLFLPPGFPSKAVTEAYLKPDVDNTPEPFQWGVPDLDNLREFLMATIGWTQERTDEVLVPVIKDMNRRAAEGTQSNITRFFEGGVGVGAREGFAPKTRDGGSVRMKEAVKKLKAKTANPLVLGTTFADEAVEWARKNDLSETAQREKQTKSKRGKGKKNVVQEERVVVDEDVDEGDDVSDKYTEERENSKHKGQRKRVKIST